MGTLPNSIIDAQGEVIESRGERGVDPLAPALVGSLMLHAVAVVLIILGLPALLKPPPENEHVMPVDLVKLAAMTEAPPAEHKAALPQQKASEISQQDSPDPVPLQQALPPPPAQPSPSIEISKPDPPVAVTPARKKSERRRVRPATERRAAKPPQAPTISAADLDTRLDTLSKQQQLQARLRPDPRTQDDRGESNLDAISVDAAPGRQAGYSVKDFIRAQIEQRWYLEKTRRGITDFTVSIHLRLNRDGSVAAAEIVEDPRFAKNDVYQALALSARNAALLSSPLRLPAGRYDEIKDITLTFNPRDVLH